MRISVFGLGYVGAVAAVCLADAGHDVIGVDPNPVKVDLLKGGKSPIIEASMMDLTRDAVAACRLTADTTAYHAVLTTELSLICVGTPSRSNGSLDLQYVESVCREIGTALRLKEAYHVVVVRSTVLPGSIRNIIVPALESTSGKVAGRHFGVCHNPEFLREGTAVHDYYHPPKTVIGELDERSGEPLMMLYRDLDAPLFRVPIEVAEMVKYTDNAWHALKVCYANEIGTICKCLNIDSHQVMDIFCHDTKLNLSPTYLKPGFAFGGSCLPKDVRALTYHARSLDLNVPLLFSILSSNHEQVERVIRLIHDKGHRKVGVLGFSFKAGTDDLRESPVVELIERLLGQGHDIRIYDRNVNLARLVGSNREYILNQIPHICSMMVDTIEEVLAHAEIVVVGNQSEEFAEAVSEASGAVSVIDLVRITDNLSGQVNYHGICW